jgi:NAD(P)-dependent dehydrogenase (short-subunit alcohol dehydrogenase family)
MKTAVITGVSTGIGRAAAKSLIGAGWRVCGSVRKAADGEAAAKELGPNFTPLLFDVTDARAVEAAAQKVGAELKGRTLDALVNNAGVAVAGPVRYLPLDELQRQLDINLFGPIRVVQSFAGLLGADSDRQGPKGRIVNMSSVAGKIASPFMGPYAMSKHALEAMSESLRREMLVHGIDVVIIGPGAVKTPIWGKADELDTSRYANTEYGALILKMKNMMQAFGDAGIEADEVGALVLHVLTTQKPKTRYAVLRNKFMMWTLPNMLPRRLVDKMVAKRFGMTAE